MKILPINDIRKADAFTIAHEPIADIDLMERAANAVYDWVLQKATYGMPVKIFCGTGNNGGDGLALGRALGLTGFPVSVYMVKYADKLSSSCQINFGRLREMKKVQLIEIKEGDPMPEISDEDLVVDALFGSGLSRPVTGFVADLINHINSKGKAILAIDAPSGFFSDSTNTAHEGAIVKADYTLTFQFPKLGFLFSENESYLGEWHVIDIGLHQDFIKDYDAENHLGLKPDAARLLKPRSKFSHKGTYGHGLLIAGSSGKMGAAVLAAKAGLRAGAGLITAHIPKTGNTILQTAVPEVMLSLDEADDFFSAPPELSKYNAIAIGPGLGMDEQSQKALKLLIQNSANPMILDADALNILSENKTWISFLPKASILTPHPKEFERLAGPSNNEFERHDKQVEFSRKYHCYIILKGAHSCISTPEGKSYFNSSGNPGMATGGSGDVLTGILLGLLAQSYSPLECCILGVYLHGLSGDIAAKKQGQEAMIAGDIVGNLGKAFRKLYRK